MLLDDLVKELARKLESYFQRNFGNTTIITEVVRNTISIWLRNMGQINSIKLKLNFKGDGLKIDINVNLKQFNISWQEEIIDALKKIIEIIKKYDLKNPRIFNDYFIDISELMKKLKFTPSGNSGFLYTQIEEDKYKPLSFLSSVESGIPTTFTANVNISNHTMEEITEGITKLILNFYDEINDILNNQVFIVDKFIDIIKQRID